MSAPYLAIDIEECITKVADFEKLCNLLSHKDAPILFYAVNKSAFRKAKRYGEYAYRLNGDIVAGFFCSDCCYFPASQNAQAVNIFSEQYSIWCAEKRDSAHDATYFNKLCTPLDAYSTFMREHLRQKNGSLYLFETQPTSTNIFQRHMRVEAAVYFLRRKDVQHVLKMNNSLPNWLRASYLLANILFDYLRQETPPSTTSYSRIANNPCMEINQLYLQWLKNHNPGLLPPPFHGLYISR